MKKFTRKKKDFAIRKVESLEGGLDQPFDRGNVDKDKAVTPGFKSTPPSPHINRVGGESEVNRGHSPGQS